MKNLKAKLETFSESSIALFLAMILLTTSCTLYDNDTNYDNDIELISKSGQTASFYIEDLHNSIVGDENMDERMIIYEDWRLKHNIDHISTTGWDQYLDIDFNDAIEVLINKGFSEDVIDVYNNIESNLEREEDLKVVIDIFEAEISQLNLSSEEQLRTDLFISVINNIIEIDLQSFEVSDKSGCSWFLCAGATYALVQAVIGLTAVAATGVGVFLAILGYIFAAAAWYAACDPCLGGHQQ